MSLSLAPSTDASCCACPHHDVYSFMDLGQPCQKRRPNLDAATMQKFNPMLQSMAIGFLLDLYCGSENFERFPTHARKNKHRSGRWNGKSTKEDKQTNENEEASAQSRCLTVSRMKGSASTQKKTTVEKAGVNRRRDSHRVWAGNEDRNQRR